MNTEAKTNLMRTRGVAEVKRAYIFVLFLVVMVSLDTQGIAVRTVAAAVLPAPTLSSPGNGSTLTTLAPPSPGTIRPEQPNTISRSFLPMVMGRAST